MFRCLPLYNHHKHLQPQTKTMLVVQFHSIKSQRHNFSVEWIKKNSLTFTSSTIWMKLISNVALTSERPKCINTSMGTSVIWHPAFVEFWQINSKCRVSWLNLTVALAEICSTSLTLYVPKSEAPLFHRCITHKFYPHSIWRRFDVTRRIVATKATE